MRPVVSPAGGPKRLLPGRSLLSGLLVLGLAGGGVLSLLPVNAARAGDKEVGTGVGILGGALLGSFVGKKKNRAQNALIGGAVGGLLGHTLSGSNANAAPAETAPAQPAGVWQDPNARYQADQGSEPMPETAWPVPTPGPNRRYQMAGYGTADQPFQESVPSAPALDTSRCQPMSYQIEENGRQVTVSGVACHQPDGRWVMLEQR